MSCGWGREDRGPGLSRARPSSGGGPACTHLKEGQRPERTGWEDYDTLIQLLMCAFTEALQVANMARPQNAELCVSLREREGDRG